MSRESDNQKAIDRLDDVIYGMIDRTSLKTLEELGDYALKIVKDHEWNNDTFNLEDSLGYGIYKDGALIKTKFLNPAPLSDTPRIRYLQEEVGRTNSEKVLSDYKAGPGYDLVVVAGMYYARWLEIRYKLDVLTNSYTDTKDMFLSVFKRHSKEK